MKRAARPPGRDACHGLPHAASRRMLRADMIAAFRVIMGDGMSSEFARRWLGEAVGRVQAEGPQPERPEMVAEVGGVRVTVRGHGVALLLAPGMRPHVDVDEQI